MIMDVVINVLLSTQILTTLKIMVCSVSNLNKDFSQRKSTCKRFLHSYLLKSKTVPFSERKFCYFFTFPDGLENSDSNWKKLRKVQHVPSANISTDRVTNFLNQAGNLLNVRTCTAWWRTVFTLKFLSKNFPGKTMGIVI